ncbi:hypothetical protein MTO96_002472 [Rhipicephalus appendiculatus]
MAEFLHVAFWIFTLLTPTTIIGSLATEVSEQAKLPPADLMRYFGYNVEVHKVTTADGYILEVDRILPSSNGNTTSSRTPMLLVHGLLANAVSWTANLPSQSPGFLLADAGFDVWLVNSRGVPQSNYHVNLTTNDPQFWAWSFEQIGTFDMPAVIDYILNQTGFAKVGLLTTSQGTTASLVLFSMRPEYNDKAKGVKAVNDIVTDGGFLVTNGVQQRTLATACDSFLREVCYAPLAVLYGKNPKQHNSTRVPVYVTNLPVGSSSRNVLHFAQVFRAKNLVRFNYGEKKNKDLYGQADPPPYPLEKVRVPFAIYQGEGDIFADPQDVQDLAERLQEVLVRRKIMPDPDFGHLDFIFGYNATGFLHRDMIDLVSNYTSIDS